MDVALVGSLDTFWDCFRVVLTPDTSKRNLQVRYLAISPLPLVEEMAEIEGLYNSST